VPDATEPARDPLAILTDGAAAAARSDDLDGAIETLLRIAVDATGAATAVVFLQDPDRPGLQLAGATGLAPDALAGLAAAAGVTDHPVATAVRERRSELTDDAAYLPLIVATAGLQLVIGVLAVQWTAPAPRSVADRAVLAGVTDLLAVSVDRARLSATASERSDWFERMAHTDPLTGLANERTVGRILELELARAGRQGGEVSIVMFDIDDFQATNRDGGHQAGDDVLRRVAAVLAESVRLVDTVGRIGGDEFVLVAPGSAGLTVARRVLEGIVSLPAVAGRPISVSAGVARFPADGTDAASLIEAATAALAQARADGRGHAVLSPLADQD
jgi:diguanylate cyclase (GGDEF)-like protein